MKTQISTLYFFLILVIPNFGQGNGEHAHFFLRQYLPINHSCRSIEIGHSTFIPFDIGLRTTNLTSNFNGVYTLPEYVEPIYIEAYITLKDGSQEIVALEGPVSEFSRDFVEPQIFNSPIYTLKFFYGQNEIFERLKDKCPDTLEYFQYDFFIRLVTEGENPGNWESFPLADYTFSGGVFDKDILTGVEDGDPNEKFFFNICCDVAGKIGNGPINPKISSLPNSFSLMDELINIENFSNEENNLKFRLIDLFGNSLSNWTQFDYDILRLQLKNLPIGVYIIHMKNQNNHQITTEKVLNLGANW